MPADKPVYTAEEQAVLDKYVEEWDVVRRGEELIRRSEYRQLVGYIFDQIQQAYGPALQYIESRSGKDQYSDIKELVPDYDLVRDKTIEWAKAQPSFLKTAYERVISEGTPQEVRDLIDIYKKASGYQPPPSATVTSIAPAAPAAPAGGGMAAPADPKVAAAVTALKPVATSRTERTEGPDPGDFAGAFAEFTAEAAR